jgi:transglutaminase-like putative cysteine protease
MHFEIEPVTSYAYNRSVHLGPPVLRLTPRCDGSQQLLEYSRKVSPRPSLQCSVAGASSSLEYELAIQTRH